MVNANALCVYEIVSHLTRSSADIVAPLKRGTFYSLPHVQCLFRAYCSHIVYQLILPCVFVSYARYRISIRIFAIGSHWQCRACVQQYFSFRRLTRCERPNGHSCFSFSFMISTAIIKAMLRGSQEEVINVYLGFGCHKITQGN